jgi:hypothetical protein
MLQDRQRDKEDVNSKSWKVRVVRVPWLVKRCETGFVVFSSPHRWALSYAQVQSSKSASSLLNRDGSFRNKGKSALSSASMSSLPGRAGGRRRAAVIAEEVTPVPTMPESDEEDADEDVLDEDGDDETMERKVTNVMDRLSIPWEHARRLIRDANGELSLTEEAAGRVTDARAP